MSPKLLPSVSQYLYINIVHTFHAGRVWHNSNSLQKSPCPSDEKKLRLDPPLVPAHRRCRLQFAAHESVGDFEMKGQTQMLILSMATCCTEALSDLATCSTPSIGHSPVARATASDSSHPDFLFCFASDRCEAVRRGKDQRRL